jgi:protease I
MTSYKSIKADVINAGGEWEDSAVVTDNGVITSRNPGHLAFTAKIIAEVKEGRHRRPAAIRSQIPPLDKNFRAIGAR